MTSGHEAVERLLGAAVRIAREVGDGIDHRTGDGGREAHGEFRLVRAALFGHFHQDAGGVLVRIDRDAPCVLARHAVDEHRQLALDGIAIVAGIGLHADGGLAFLERLDAPIDAGFRAGGDFDGLVPRRRWLRDCRLRVRVKL